MSDENMPADNIRMFAKFGFIFLQTNMGVFVKIAEAETPFESIENYIKANKSYYKQIQKGN